MALEEEIATWSAYRRSLGSGARRALDESFNKARTYCSASSNAVRPSRFQGMFMASVFDHERRMDFLATRLEKLRLEMRDVG